MAARSLNKVQLIGNLTRDPELRYTPNGQAVASFGLATSRQWTTDTGEKKEEVDFHNIVAWGKLGEICSQYLKKGSKMYVEGRIQTRSYESKDGQQKTRTDIVMHDMIMLDGKRRDEASESTSAISNVKPKQENSTEVKNDEVISPDDIPF